eukprot:894947-Rhodomonas_salina.1
MLETPAFRTLAPEARESFIANVREQAIDAESMLCLSDDDLRELGLSFVKSRQTLLTVISETFGAPLPGASCEPSELHKDPPPTPLAADARMSIAMEGWFESEHGDVAPSSQRLNLEGDARKVPAEATDAVIDLTSDSEEVEVE